MAAINRGEKTASDLEEATDKINEHLDGNPDKHATSEITGLDTALNDLHSHLDNNPDKHDVSQITGLVSASGYTGSFDVVESVDFTNETTVTKTLTFENGLLKTIT
jgi:hypothetical protein